MDVVTHLPADAQAAEPVQQRDRLLHHPAVHVEPGAVRGATAGDARFERAVREWMTELRSVIA
jgi:hypothetical protein